MQHIHVAGDASCKIQTGLRLPADVLPPRDVHADLKTQRLLVHVQKLVLQKKMPVAVTVPILPYMKGVMAQPGIGTEAAGSVQTPQRLIAFASPVVPDAEDPFPRGIEIVYLMRQNVAQGNDVLGLLQYGVLKRIPVL